MQSSESYGTKTSLDSLQVELDTLALEYGDYLEQESLQADLACISAWIASYQRGSNEAAEFLQNHGAALLIAIKTKLKAAAEEMQRVDEESPNGEHFTGGKAHRLSRALAIATQAVDSFEAIVKKELNH